MNETADKKSKSALWGKISLILGFINIFLIISVSVSAAFFEIEMLTAAMSVLFLVLAPVGFITGLIGLFANRSWLGLLLNALFLLLIIFAGYSYLAVCCAPPPQINQ